MTLRNRSAGRVAGGGFPFKSGARQGGNTLLDGIKTLLGKIDPDRLHADEHASVDLR